VLAGVPPDQVREVLRVARRRRFSRNEVVFHRGDPADTLHLIASGHFAIQVMTPLGERVTIAIRGPGESFGEMALVDQAPRSATVSATEDAETYSVFRDDFLRLRERHPAVGDAVVAFLAREIRMLGERLAEALYVPVEKRVRRRIVELAGLYPAEDGRPTIPLTQEAIAELAGTTRPTVNGVLKEEERRGTIELARGRLRVLDLEALARRAR